MNRPEELRRLLTSVARTSPTPDEVWVSDDSRDVGMRERVKGVTKEFPFVVYLEGPGRGLSANRNNCLRRVTGDLVVFLDDDNWVEADYFGNVRQVVGAIMDEGRSERVIVTGFALEPQGPVTPSRLSFLGFYLSETPEPGEVETVCINATVFPKCLFGETSFDEHIRYGTDERDISCGARRLGYRIVYAPTLSVHHVPSSVNRSTYASLALESHFYFGLKRYWLHQPSVPKFVLYNIYAPLNVAGHAVKVGRPGDVVRGLHAFAKAWSTFLAARGGSVSGLEPSARR
jgi:GT2 family glycosyltransferase